MVNQSLTVNGKKTPAITSTDQLTSGNTVAAQRGTTGESWARENLVPKGVQLRTFTGTTEMFDALDAGAVTGVINDQQASRAQVVGLSNFTVVQVIDTGEHYGLGSSKTNPSLLKAVNKRARWDHRRRHLRAELRDVLPRRPDPASVPAITPQADDGEPSWVIIVRNGEVLTLPPAHPTATTGRAIRSAR